MQSTLKLIKYMHLQDLCCLRRASSGVVRIDPLCFLAGCRKRRFKSGSAYLSLSIVFQCVVVY